jgi:hypothetical protein
MKTFALAIASVLLGAAPLAAQAPKKAPPQAPPKAVPTQQAKKDTLKTTTTRPGRQLNVAKADTAAPPPTIMRELFEYAREGRRDPFVSLLTTTDLRPTLSDLKLTGILLDHSGRNSVATLQDITTNVKYRVSTGSTLGRMRVTAIKSMAVIFTIDEFGTTRKDSLILRDSTKARTR